MTTNKLSEDDIKSLVREVVRLELQNYKKTIGIDMTSVETIAFTAGVYAGLHLAIEVAEGKYDHDKPLQ